MVTRTNEGFSRGKNDLPFGWSPWTTSVVWCRHRIRAFATRHGMECQTITLRKKCQSITLRKGLKHVKDKLDKPCWVDILKNIIKALDHVHNVSVLHNDLTSDNVLLEKRQEKWNPVIIDFRKARFISKPKPLMSLSSSVRERYRKLYPHIATEIVQRTGQQCGVWCFFPWGEWC